MNLKELKPPLIELPIGQTFFRVQLLRARPGTVKTNGLQTVRTPRCSSRSSAVTPRAAAWAICASAHCCGSPQLNHCAWWICALWRSRIHCCRACASRRPGVGARRIQGRPSWPCLRIGAAPAACMRLPLSEWHHGAEAPATMAAGQAGHTPAAAPGGGRRAPVRGAAAGH